METNNQNNIDLIEQYIEGNLSKEEQHKFNVRLQTDGEFANLYRFRLKIRKDLQKAKHYEKTEKLVAGTIKNIQRIKHRNTIYAIAAGLTLLIAIPGIFTVVNRDTSDNLAESDSTTMEVYEPQITLPKEVASGGEYTPGEEVMKTGIEPDSVIFLWQPETVQSRLLVVEKLHDGIESYRIEVTAGSSRLAVQKSNIGIGKFTWCLQGSVLKDTFEIVKKNRLV